jgi:hypothetical protein
LLYCSEISKLTSLFTTFFEVELLESDTVLPTVVKLWEVFLETICDYLCRCSRLFCRDFLGAQELLSWVEDSLSHGRRSVVQFVSVSGSPLGPMARFHPYPFFSDNCFLVLLAGRPLWREDGSVTYSAVADRSVHWGPITIHCRLIWDCVLSSSPLTTRRGYGGGILTRLHTGHANGCLLQNSF